MQQFSPSQNKAIVIEAFDTLFIVTTPKRQSDFGLLTIFSTALLSQRIETAYSAQ
jgi:hypothetical protein